MNKREAYKQGKDTGYDIAICNRAGYSLATDDTQETFINDMVGKSRESKPFIYSDWLWMFYEVGIHAGILQAIEETK